MRSKLVLVAERVELAVSVSRECVGDGVRAPDATVVGRYMMIRTHECSECGGFLEGDMGEELPLVHRCSIGACAGI